MFFRKPFVLCELNSRILNLPCFHRCNLSQFHSIFTTTTYNRAVLRPAFCCFSAASLVSLKLGALRFVPLRIPVCVESGGASIPRSFQLKWYSGETREWCCPSFIKLSFSDVLLLVDAKWSSPTCRNVVAHHPHDSDYISLLRMIFAPRLSYHAFLNDISVTPRPFSTEIFPHHCLNGFAVREYLC